MGLLTTEVEVKINGKTMDYYEKLGYFIPRRKDKWGRMKVECGITLKVKIKDLPNSSNYKVIVECDGCGKELESIYWYNYLKYVKEDGRYYCNKCAANGNKKWTSFEEWCITNNQENLLTRWDYIKNKKLPTEIVFGTSTKYWFKCPLGIHESELKNICSFTKDSGGSMDCRKCNSFAQYGINKFGDDFLNLYWSDKNIKNAWDIISGGKEKVWLKCQVVEYHEDYETICSIFTMGCRCPYCQGTSKTHPKDSFAQWGIDTICIDFLEKYWDYEKNTSDPWTIKPQSNLKGIWIKCQEKDYHGSYVTYCNHFYDECRCPSCASKQGSLHSKDSFAQYHIDNTDSLFLEKYWDWDKNDELGIDPWKLSKKTKEQVWIICQDKLYHESYSIECSHFTRGSRCSYCNGNRTHYLDSLGCLFPETLNIWSEKNKKSPYEYSPASNKKVWWRCENEKHKEYYRVINNSNIYNFNCPECIQERSESFLQEKVRIYLESLKYTILHERNCTIVPRNPKTKYPLPFDNEVVELKLLCEVNGLQHYKATGYHNQNAKKKNTTPKYELHYQQLKDRYKRILAKSQGYNFLEIPYWTNDENETWKQLIDDKIEEIYNSNII